MGASGRMPGIAPTADFARRRAAMVDNQVAGRGIRDPRVLAAMRAVPRDHFVPPDLADFAYADRALPIGAGQTISQPYVVAVMVEAAAAGPDDRILEVGLGSGYAAAVMSLIGRTLYAIDRVATLVDSAAGRLAALGYDNVRVRTVDGTRGWTEAAPFDAIVVSAGGPCVPRPLCDQLAPHGRLIIPVGEPGAQRLLRVTRAGASAFREEDLGAVLFVPLIGEHGWPDGFAGTRKGRR